MSLTKKQLGNIGEQKACNYLVKNNLELIQKNFFSRFGEIDLVMLDQNSLVFIEVRSRKNYGFGSDLESINFNKQQKLRKAADYFLLTHKKYQKIPARFDVILVPPVSKTHKSDDGINWIKNAF